MGHPNEFAAFFIWQRNENGVVEFLVVDAIPTNPEYLKSKNACGDVQIKPPGGRADKDDKDLVMTGRRETKEEAGLTMKLRAKPQLIYQPRPVKGHRKVAYLVHADAFRGRLRTKVKEDKNSRLLPPRWMPAIDFLRLGFQTTHNKFYINAALKACEVLEVPLD